MGWFYGYNSRKELAEELTKGFENDMRKITCLRKFFSGNNLWCVFECQSKAASTDVERWITVFLMRRAGSDWGYKPVDESMGPCEHSCPLSFLDMVREPERSEGYHDWRAGVREYWARRHQKLTIGQHIKLTNGHTYRVVALARGIARGVDLADGYTYKLPRRMLILEKENTANA